MRSFTTSVLYNGRFTISVRDVLAWINFINKCSSSACDSSDVASSHDRSAALVYIHGACLVFLDALGSGTYRVIAQI